MNKYKKKCERLKLKICSLRKTIREMAGIRGCLTIAVRNDKTQESLIADKILCIEWENKDGIIIKALGGTNLTDIIKECGMFSFYIQLKDFSGYKFNGLVFDIECIGSIEDDTLYVYFYIRFTGSIENTIFTDMIFCD